MKKEILRPTFYQSFQCIASDCEDTCCKGWRINIDERTYQKYRNLKPSPIKTKLLDAIELSEKKSKYDYANFKVSKNPCRMLSENGLCEIHKELGPSYLCYTCSMYPRSVVTINGEFEFSLDMSCPEVARMALSQANGIDFELVEDELGDVLAKSLILPISPDNYSYYLLDVRNFVISILQERSLSIEDRLMFLGLFFEQLDEASPREIPLIIDAFMREIESEDIRELLNMTYDADLFAMIGAEILLDFSKVKFSTTRFRSFCLNSIMGYVEDEKCSISDIARNYQRGKEIYYDEFMKEYSYALENFLVMIVYTSIFPHGAKTYRSAFKTLVNRYLIFKLMLIGNALHNGKMTLDDVYNYAYSSYREIEHGGTIMKMVLKIINKYDINDLNKMCALIKG